MASRHGASVAWWIGKVLRVLQPSAIPPIAGQSYAGGSLWRETEVEERLQCVLRGMAQVSDGKKRPLVSRTQGPRSPSAYLRPGYPLAGCSPAEPASVSPGEQAITEGCRTIKSNPTLPVRKASRGVAKEGPFFVQRMGSTSRIVPFRLMSSFQEVSSADTLTIDRLAAPK